MVALTSSVDTLCVAADGAASGSEHPRCEQGDALQTMVLARAANVRRQRGDDAHDTNFALLRVENCGTPIVQLAAVAASAAGVARSSSFEPVLQHFAPENQLRALPGRTVIAQATGRSSCTHIAEKLNAIAAAMFFGSRFVLSSAMAHLQRCGVKIV